MWFGDIDVPQAVLDAAAAGKLVLFVGAGASRAHPSDLPDFAQLVRNIGELTGWEPSEREVKQPDVFLGQLDDRGVNVHQLVAEEIGQASSQPNRLHYAIVRVAAAHEMPRIVTTNYDRHLTSAAAALTVDLRTYEAPALPVGDDFHGIVYLHGSLSQPSRQLVVTDSDFGHAYLREAWAARFLERMFSTFTVVFIGYSHGDVVMQYLARSLGSNHSRYVFTDDAENAEWRRLGLAPIKYTNGVGDHSALPVTLERWGERSSMGQVEHRARIADLVSGEPPTIPEEVSYIESALRHPELIRYFVEARFDDTGRRHRWFEWIESRSAFADLFSDRASEQTSTALMKWIADQYISSEESTGLALRAFCKRQWPTATWNTIARWLCDYTGEFPKWLNPWLQFTLQNAPQRPETLLDRMLVNREWTNNFNLALMLFEDRTRPYLLPRGYSGSPTDHPRFEVGLLGDEYWLTRAWTKAFVPAFGQHLEQLLSLVTEQLARVYRSIRNSDPGAIFDPIAFRRSAIEQHEQDRHRDAIDVLIDAARDCIEATLSADPPLAQGYLERWSRSPDKILQRLAVHGWRIRTDLSSDGKLDWLRERRRLWDPALKHEVFQLIADALPTASNAAAQSLIDDAITGPPDDNGDEFASYRSYELLGWITDSAPTLMAAAAAFEKAQKNYPEYERGDHPDFNHYGSSGTVEDAFPFTREELHELIAQDPTDAIARLRKFKTRRHALKGPTWTGALKSLQACITANPRDGVLVAQALKDDDSDIRTALIDGWGGATLDSELLEQTLTIISGWPHDKIRKPACAMLAGGGRPEHPTPWHQIEGARHLATELWPTSDDVNGAISGEAGIMMEVANRPAGHLAKFWTRVVQWEWSDNESAWDGIPAQVGEQLDRLVSATGRNGLLARAFFASQLRFYFAADREWCKNYLLPLFDWADEKEAAVAWQGFLTWGRWDDGLLQAGLLDSYVATTTHIHELPEELHRQLAIHMAFIAIFAMPNPATWLTRFIVGAPEECRIEWAQQVEHVLIELDPDESLKQWDRWIKEYWVGRNRSVPIPFAPDEASATANWIVGLPGARTQAIDLALESEASLGFNDAELLHALAELDVAAEAKDWTRLLTYLLKHTSGPQWAIDYELSDIVSRLRKGDPALDLTELINEAMRLGVTDAAGW